eukprot:363328-Chlamydomonas_euryale.AAC.3
MRAGKTDYRSSCNALSTATAMIGALYHASWPAHGLLALVRLGDKLETLLASHAHCACESSGVGMWDWGGSIGSFMAWLDAMDTEQERVLPP